MTANRSPQAGLKLFFAFWRKYHSLDNFHYRWGKDHLKVHIVKRGAVLESAGHASEISYFVGEGLLAHIEEDAVTGKRKIMSLALPNMALMTTLHLHSHSAQSGKIVALRSGVVIAIPHIVLRRFQEYEKSVDTLIDIFCNKEKRQLTLLREATLDYPPFERYLNFARLLPEIRVVTTQQEQADLLGISRDTVQNAQYFLATRKKYRK